jgi:outer membrane protein, multidrug efflux system
MPSTGLKGINRIAGFDAGWELDFFGKYQRLLEATVDDAEAQNDLRSEVLITVIVDVARYYFDIRGLQARLQIAHNNVATG